MFDSNGLLDAVLYGVTFLRIVLLHCVGLYVTRCMTVLENGRSFTGVVFFDPGTSRHIAVEGRVIRTKYLFFVSNFALRLGIFYTKCLRHNR